jgi:hypothetical protein
MKDRTFTTSQLRALRWLPADGAWRRKPDRSIAAALNSLCLYHGDIAEGETGTFGDRGGWVSRFRLTGAGIDERASHNFPDGDAVS